MAKDPAFLFYFRDFLIGTAFMSNAEVGLYIKLLCYMADRGPISKEEVALIACGHMTKSIEVKFKVNNDGQWYNERLMLEVEKRKNWVKSRNNNRIGKNQHSKMRSYDQMKSGHMENENIDASADANAVLKRTTNTTIPSALPPAAFEDLWSKYPKRVGKKDALRHFNASVKTESELQNIWTALHNYLKSERVQKGFIQNGSTWFNNWQDWVEYKETVCPKCKGKGKFTSATGYEVVCDCPRGKG